MKINQKLKLHIRCKSFKQFCLVWNTLFFKNVHHVPLWCANLIQFCVKLDAQKTVQQNQPLPKGHQGGRTVMTSSVLRPSPEPCTADKEWQPRCGSLRNTLITRLYHHTSVRKYLVLKTKKFSGLSVFPIYDSRSLSFISVFSQQVMDDHSIKLTKLCPSIHWSIYLRPTHAVDMAGKLFSQHFFCQTNIILWLVLSG